MIEISIWPELRSIWRISMAKKDPWATQDTQADVMELLSNNDFDSMLGRTLAVEKGYHKFPWKLGGETNMGISKKRYPNEDIPNITKDRAKFLYHRDFYKNIGLDKIGYPSVAYKLFDFGVTSGPEDSIGTLQKVLNKLNKDNKTGRSVPVDKMLGKETLNELYKWNENEVADAIEESVLGHHLKVKFPKGYSKKSLYKRAIE
jgi:lysozyme family protein